MAKLRNLELRVVLDTNPLYTASASYLIRKEVTDLIAQHKNVPGLRVTWHLPSVVRDERHFQMRTEAHKFLDAIGKLERLLGHNLNITRDILDTRVREAIDRQVGEHGLTVITFDPTSVDWERLVADAAFRRPPFQIGEKEKGLGLQIWCSAEGLHSLAARADGGRGIRPPRPLAGSTRTGA